MIGKPGVERWRYSFDCHHCTKTKYIKDNIRDGIYCIPYVEGRDPIHADDDRVVRCDEFASSLMEQMSFFEEVPQ